MEQLLSSFNKDGNKPYVPESDPPRLDGFPVRWVGVMPAYSDTAAPEQVQVLFGDLTKWALGTRDLVIRVSGAMHSAYDEVRVMPIEELAVGAITDDAMAALQLAGLT